ncbi:hypothetical protein EG327_000692 [Venturia inaequalis]|uniref:Uncharacterized protein n=1 Tax=Venturia inaequalis TaxID=5025 RepID=A0A8H3VQB7_VENIN|nr:hypothetical protein EG327_000692 [Venturia inaequalis]
MHGLKQWLVLLALAGSGLSCQCTKYGEKGAKVDIEATKRVCALAGGRVLNEGSPTVQCAGACHSAMDDKCNHATGLFTNIPQLGSSCGFNAAYC